jgi:Domain of unknown function (DUF4476)
VDLDVIILNRFAYMCSVNVKRIFLIFAILWFAVKTQAQQIHFVYLQTENGQPFYVKLNNKVTSSTGAGYLILPKLTDGAYDLEIGFPKNEFPPERYHINVDKENLGYLIKNLGDKGWSLFDLQSLALVPGSSGSVAATLPAAPVKNDPFSNMLATVTKDSSILQNPVQVISDSNVAKDSGNQTNGAAVTTNIPAGKDSLNTASSSGMPVNPDSAAGSPQPSKPKQMPVAASKNIKRLLLENDTDGVQMVYVDNKENDTVRLLIPVIRDSKKTTSSAINKKPVEQDATAYTITPTPVKPDSDTVTLINDTIKIYKENAVNPVNKSRDSVRNKNANLDSVTVKKADKLQPATEKRSRPGREDALYVLPQAATSSSVNSDCKAFANDQDFLKLRKKMASESGTEQMIKVASKVFREKCFSTAQIKNLSYMFLTDEGKYMFFDAAYPHTSDSDEYPSLSSQFSDVYYLNRFKAMIHK